MNALASVQSAQDSTVPGSLVLAAVIAVGLLVTAFFVHRWIQEQEVVRAAEELQRDAV